MEFGILPAMFGMGMVNSLSEVVRIEQQTAEVALAQMHAQVQREAMQPQHSVEMGTHLPTSVNPDQGANSSYTGGSSVR